MKVVTSLSSTEEKGQDVENQLVQLSNFARPGEYEIYKEYKENITEQAKSSTSI